MLWFKPVHAITKEISVVSSSSKAVGWFGKHKQHPLLSSSTLKFRNYERLKLPGFEKTAAGDGVGDAFCAQYSACCTKKCVT